MPNERLTVDMARRIVDEVLARREGGHVVAKKKSAEDEIDDLVDDLDELEEEDVEEEDEEVEEEEEEEEDDEDDEDEEDEDEEEDPDEAPKKSRSKSKSKSKKPAKTGIGTAEVAEAAGTDSRTLRMYLRKKGVQPRDDRDGRYSWPSLKDREVQRIIKDIQKGAAAEMNKEKLAALKSKKSKKSTAKKSTKKRVRSKS